MSESKKIEVRALDVEEIGLALKKISAQMDIKECQPIRSNLDKSDPPGKERVIGECTYKIYIDSSELQGQLEKIADCFKNNYTCESVAHAIIDSLKTEKVKANEKKYA